MIATVTVTRFPRMPSEPKPKKEKAPPQTSIKVLVRTKEQLDVISEATNRPVWKVVEDLLAAELPGAHAAAERALAKIRSEQAKMGKVLDSTRRGVD